MPFLSYLEKKIQEGGKHDPPPIPNVMGLNHFEILVKIKFCSKFNEFKFYFSNLQLAGYPERMRPLKRPKSLLMELSEYLILSST